MTDSRTGSDPLTAGRASPFAAIALAAARLGADAITAAVRSGGLAIETKRDDSDFVTTADYAAERAVLGLLAAARPADAWLSEEAGEQAGTSGVRWVIDPLDGTLNFVHRRDEYAVSVGAERDGEVFAGALVRPTSGAWLAAEDTWAAGRDGPPRVTGTTDMAAALFSVGFPADAELRPRVLDLIGDLLPEARDFRRAGSSACDLMAVAAGTLDVYLGYGVHDWDVAGGIAVVRAAGGRAEWVETVSGIPLLAAGTPAVLDPFVERAAKV